MQKKKNCVEYIRLKKYENLPKGDCYSALFEDYSFFDRYNEKHEKKMDLEIFEFLIQTWELNSVKKNLCPLNIAKNLVIDKIDFSYHNKIEEIYNVLFNAYFFVFVFLILLNIYFFLIKQKYWEKRRIELNKPLLRINFKPTIEDTNPNVAFRPREKSKMLLRNRANDYEKYLKVKIYKNKNFKIPFLV